MAVAMPACKNNESLLAEFRTEIPIIDTKFNIVNPEQLGMIEGIHANDSLLITLDFHDAKSYSLFNSQSGEMLMRFGEIGHGNNEIPIGCDGIIYNGDFVVFDDEQKIVAKYDIIVDSISVGCDIIKYKIDDTQLSKIAIVNDSLYLGLGTYKDKYQYVLFDMNGRIFDYDVEIYNSSNKEFNTYHKFLSNQGKIAKHPTRNLFVGTINLSSNIDFLSVENNKIITIKSIRFKDPLYKIYSKGRMNRVLPTEHTINGFIDICATGNYVFALYSEENLKKQPYCADIILVFDWNGNPVGKVHLPNNAYYIAATSTKLIAVEKDEKGVYGVNAYSLN